MIGSVGAALSARRAPDLRLVPAALGVWATVLLGLLLGPVAGGGVGLVGAVVALRTRRHGDQRAGWLAVAACAAAAAVVVTAHGMLVGSHPLRPAAERGAAATLRVVLTDDPHPIRTAGYGATPGGATQVLVSAALEHVQVGGGGWRSGGRVLLIAPAPEWAHLLPGQAVTAEGVLAPAARSDLTVAVLRVRGRPAGISAPPWWQTAAGGLRSGLRDAAAAVLPEASAGLLPGLAVGDTSRQTREVEDDFLASGLTHLTAVSGANLTIVAGTVLGLLRLARAGPRWGAGLSMAAVAAFVVLARPSPSVVRAAVMGGIVLLALALGRGRSAVPALAAAVIVLLLVDPALAVHPGFVLSVLATGALVLVAPGWTDALRRRGLPLWVAAALVVPTAAFLVTAPVIAGLSGHVAPVSMLANLLVVPAVAPATVLGVLAAVVSPVSPLAAQACAWLAAPFVGWLVAVADRAAAVPGSVLPWPGGTGGALLLVAVLGALVLVGRARRGRAVLLAVLLGLALVLVPTRVAPPGWPPAQWHVVACDVGQGDAIVLATGVAGHAVLVDAGPDTGPVDACLDRLGVHTLALVVLSHLHADHVGGLDGALRGRATGGVGVGPVREPRRALTDAARSAAAAGAPLVALAAGQRLRWPGLTLDVLGPLHPDPYVDADDGTAVNDGSVVLRASTPAGTALLTGDVELAAQADLVDAGLDLRADVLKMPHHGSRYTSVEFLNAVAPRAVLVSVGAGNSYRHPDPGLVTGLTRAGALVRRTDEAGDVALVAGSGTGTVELVARGDPLPARRRRFPAARRRPFPAARGRRFPEAWPRRFPATRGRRGSAPGAARISRDRPTPPAPRRWWTARWRSGRSARPRRRGS